MLRRTSAILGSQTVFELRIGTMIPSMYDEAHTVATQHMGDRPKVGRCFGYWTTQIGGLNQFVQMWEFDSLTHRYECRKVLENDKDWQRNIIKPFSKFYAKEENMLLRRIHQEGNATTMSYKYLMHMSSEPDLVLTGPSAILAASFQVIVGNTEGKYIHVVKAKNLDDLLLRKSEADGASKLMGPARWSSSLQAVWR